ncbi:MAG: hypothetical protein QXS22_06500 [Acidilobaceae archaeon]
MLKFLQRLGLTAYRLYLKIPLPIKFLVITLLLGRIIWRSGDITLVSTSYGLILFKASYASVFKVLRFNIYNPLREHIKGARYLDVGAGVGDSCLYAWRNGASYIKAIEPDPIVSRFLSINMKINNVKSTIDERCAGEACYIVNWDNGTITRVEKEGITWEEILSEGYDVVKVDCEGCEFTLNSNHINSAKVWLIEVHGEIKEFINRIPKNYKVKVIGSSRDSSTLKQLTLILLENAVCS